MAWEPLGLYHWTHPPTGAQALPLLQIWTAQRREGGLISAAAMSLADPQRAEIQLPACGWEAFEIPFGEVWVFLLFNFLRTTWRRLCSQISSNGCNQSITMCWHSTCPDFCQGYGLGGGKGEGNVSCCPSPQVVCPTCFWQAEVPAWAIVREGAKTAPLISFSEEDSLSFEGAQQLAFPPDVYSKLFLATT